MMKRSNIKCHDGTSLSAIITFTEFFETLYFSTSILYFFLLENQFLFFLKIDTTNMALCSDNQEGPEKWRFLDKYI